MSRMHFGEHPELEAEANRLLKDSLAGVFSHGAKSDILTPWKQRDRRRREVYTRNGVPDPSVRRGMFHRAINTERPEMNSRDGIAASNRGRSPRDSTRG